MKVKCISDNLFEIEFTDDEIQEMAERGLIRNKDATEAIETWITNGMAGD